eukprot:scaffold2338_cov301-Prasinococcus_capsulatus_cf.AAC.3
MAARVGPAVARASSPGVRAALPCEAGGAGAASEPGPPEALGLKSVREHAAAEQVRTPRPGSRAARRWPRLPDGGRG